MTSDPAGNDIRLSDSERLYALNVLSEHYAEGRLDVDEFYERSEATSTARTVAALQETFRGLPGGVPLEEIDGRLRRRTDIEPTSGPGARPAPAVHSPEAELASLRHRGKLVESFDGVILGITLVAFLVLQFAFDWDYAWIVWPSLLLTLGLPRLIFRFNDEDEEIYEELKESDARARKQRLKQATERIRELEAERKLPPN